MMRLFINSLAASAGGGLTYICNVLPKLAARSDLKVIITLDSELCAEFANLRNVDFLGLHLPAARRFWHEQVRLPGIIQDCRADVLLSTGNFALRNSPVPQILLSRNSIYTCREYYRDLRNRHEYRALLETRLRAVVAKKSITWADVTVAPTASFADELQRWTGREVLSVPHGFDQEAFTNNADPLASEVETKVRTADNCLKLLFVSHYNYYRNFETLIRALALLRNSARGRAIKLLLTCTLVSGSNPGMYRPDRAAELIKELGVSDMVIELGAIPYRQLHQVYRSADVYVTPAYTETFAHPLVEAMASGVPVIASDLAVHREICGGAARFFSTFSAPHLAEAVMEVASSPEKMAQMAALGLLRSKEFSWELHAQEIVSICESLIARAAPGARSQAA